PRAARACRSSASPCHGAGLNSRRLNPIIRFVSEISATEASKRFADLLDAVEHRGETFTVVRRGRVVATISPARRGTGADLRRTRADRPPDDRGAGDLRDLRQFVGDAAIADPWSD